MKFFGKIGYAVSGETSPGVWTDVVVERDYYGDVLRNSRKLDSGEKVNDDISVGNSISVVADAILNNNFHNIRYISWMGANWRVQDVVVEHPRLIFRLGGVYNGEKAGPTPDPVDHGDD